MTESHENTLKSLIFSAFRAPLDQTTPLYLPFSLESLLQKLKINEISSFLSEKFFLMKYKDGFKFTFIAGFAC